MSSLKELLSQEALNLPYKLHPGPRAAIALTVSFPGAAKNCVFPYIHLLYIRRQDQEIILRFSVAEVRIVAASADLCDKLIDAFGELKIERIIHSNELNIALSLAVTDQVFEPV
jgi:hypothetical protein